MYCIVNLSSLSIYSLKNSKLLLRVYISKAKRALVSHHGKSRVGRISTKAEQGLNPEAYALRGSVDGKRELNKYLQSVYRGLCGDCSLEESGRVN